MMDREEKILIGGCVGGTLFLILLFLLPFFFGFDEVSNCNRKGGWWTGQECLPYERRP
jgi:hypothetical protein